MRGSAGRSESEQHGSLFADLPFVVMAAHELKAPLALMRQLALSLESGTVNDSEEQQKMLQQIVLVSERALRLTTSLSRSSRLEQSLFDLEPLNPQQICEEIAHELTPLYKACGREIRVSVRHRPLLVVANRDLLRRVILNFGDNALHYAGSDSPVELRAVSRGNGQTIRIGVRDYGPQVPSTAWRRLQTHLGTAPQPLHNRPQSSGLGLLVASQFAGAMRGHIGALRHRDGATFYIDINASTQLSLL